MAIQLETNQLQDGLITTAKLAADAVNGSKIADDSIDSEHIAADSIDTEHYAPASVDTDALGANAVTAGKADLSGTWNFTGNLQSSGATVATQAYVDASAAGFELLDDVIDIVALASTAPPSEVSGDRYIIANSSSPNAGWDGVITGDGDIVEFNGTSWTLATDVSADAAGKALLVWNTTDGVWNKLSGGATSWTEHGGLAGVTAGAALSKSGNTMNVNVDNSSVEVSSDSLRVKALGITNAMLAGSITAEKINKGAGLTDNAGNLELASGVAGAGLAIASQVLSVNVDNVGLQIATDTLQLKDLGVTTAKLAADAVNGTKIADDSIDSEHIVDGSVDNVHLAGSITAEKLNKTARIIDNAGSLDIGAGVVATSHLADDSVTVDKVGFSSEWDVLSPNGTATAFDLSQPLNAAFQKIIVIRGGAVQKQVAASPADDSEYTVSLTGGAGGVARITFGSAPANGVDLRVWFMY